MVSTKYESCKLSHLNNIVWKSKIKAQVLDSPEDIKSAFPNIKRISISGMAIDDSVNANEWALDKKEMASVAEQLIGKQLTINHDTNVESVIGKIITAKANEKDVEFSAEIISENSNVLIPIISGMVDSVSIEADAESSCSLCGKAYISGMKPCKCAKEHQVIKNVKVERLSVVANPAYANTKFIPISFAAAIDEKIKEVSNLAEPKIEGEKKSEEEPKKDVKIPESEELKNMQERLKKAEEKIAEFAELFKKKAEEEEEKKKSEEEKKKGEQEEELTPEEKKKKLEEEKCTEKKKGAVLDKTKSVSVVDISQDMILPEEIQKETPKGGFQDFFASMQKKFNITG